MKFYLGTHKPQWLQQTTVPLFVSEMTLRTYKKLPRSIGSWALDSGGFSQLFLRGGWPVGSEQLYIEHVQRYRDEVGNMEWAAPQDWMCEPVMLAKTGQNIQQHQEHSVNNFIELRTLDATLPFIPVLQGYTLSDYIACATIYTRRGVDLVGRVGVGTLCRRQGTKEAELIVRTLACILPKAHLHVFGAKVTGLPHFGSVIGSADSMAWSYHARRRPALPGHTHKNCANCLEYALTWYSEVLQCLHNA